MDASARAMVEAIHANPTHAVLYLSGGVSQALGWLMSVSGASNTVLETVMPYSRMFMIQLLAKVPSQFASRQTAEDMALMAFNRAQKLSQPGFPALGMGFTCSLASKHPKLGDHRVNKKIVFQAREEQPRELENSEKDLQGKLRAHPLFFVITMGLLQAIIDSQ